jgi:DnaJ-class molecular chaperone
MNYYDLLEIHPKASGEVIKAAYKVLAQKYHPDKNPAANSMNKMQSINEAYTVLSDKVKRENYDQVLKQTVSTKKETANFENNELKIYLQYINKIRETFIEFADLLNTLDVLEDIYERISTPNEKKYISFKTFKIICETIKEERVESQKVHTAINKNREHISNLLKAEQLKNIGEQRKIKDFQIIKKLCYFLLIYIILPLTLISLVLSLATKEVNWTSLVQLKNSIIKR